MDFTLTPRAQELKEKLLAFMDERIYPAEEVYAAQMEEAGNPEFNPPIIEELKAEARSRGLWNLFLPHATEWTEGLSNSEYAPLAEITGRSPHLAPEALNCSAPDTGNMELLAMFGTPAQQEEWLAPLLEGEIRSCFAMTEPDVASSDATNMQATAVVEGDEIVLNGKKWWTSGLGDPMAKVAIFMAHTPNPDKDRHHQHSMVLVPLDTPGIEIKRMVPVFGEYDAPHGHGEVHFHNVRVPVANVIKEPGAGFEIAQGRLGPGRIHHCMRCLGAAEWALELMIDRGMNRTAFHKPLLNLGGNRERVADARIAIDQARLLTLYAAWKIDEVGPLDALTEVSAIKVVAPNVLQKIVDDAIQIHGGAGVSRDTPLTGMFAMARSLRLADGPDEVHKGLIARVELMKRGYFR